MNRVIKFRAWHKAQKEMVYFNLRDQFQMAALAGLMTGEDETGYLMQYTGLQDKNGQDIYEGDFIEDDEHFYGVVYWCDDSFMWCVSDVGGLCDFCIGKNVIGNIYENPELLEPKE